LTQTIPKVYVTRFVQLVTRRQFAEAERVLDRLKQKIKMNERNRGYFQALYGMLLAQKSNNDRYAFLLTQNFQDKKELLDYRREFLRQSEFRLHADYDRGFFSAWADYMRIMSKLELKSASIRKAVQNNTTLRENELKTDETKKPKKEMNIEEEKEKKDFVEKLEDSETAEISEPRQSLLYDFSK
jgi:hypothetical protein